MNTDKFNRLLITFLAQESCLFDPNFPLYNNINERHQAYSRIGKQLRECGADETQVNRVNDRYQALKRRFISEYAKVQKGKTSTWPYYAELEKLLSTLAEKTHQNSFRGELVSNLSQQPDVDLNAEPVCSLVPTPSYGEKKRKFDDDSSSSKNQTDFRGIFDYLALKLNEMNDQTQKDVIEKMLRIVHNPSISLDDRQLPNSSQWPVPPDQY